MHIFFSSHDRVEKEIQARMIADHLSTLHAEAPSMVSKESSHDLSNMYTLLRTVQGGIAPLIENMQEHIKDRGFHSIMNLKGDNVSLFNRQ